MSVIISAVQENSPAERAKISAGETLVSIDGNDIMDVLDYRFYQNNKKLELTLLDLNGKVKTVKIKKDEYEEIGL